MKKALTLMLTAILLCAAAFAIAEDDIITIDITYTGEYYQLGEYDLMFLLPDGWVEIEPEDLYLAFQNAEGDQFMMVDELEVSEDETLESLLAEIEADGSFTNIVPLEINGYTFVTYVAPEDNINGAYLLNQGQPTTLHFMFAPADNEELTGLTVQLLASLAPAEA